MNFDLRYYLSIFWRRLPLFLLVAGLIGGLGVAAASKLPPMYVSQTTLVIEGAQIPESMVGPSVETPPEEQLELFQARLLTRANMLDIARKLKVFDNIASMNADAIVQQMRSNTTIRRQAGRNRATVMTITFSARSPTIAAGVLNEYLTLILQQDVSNRTERASQTEEFFRQEVKRLSEDLDETSKKIVAFKNENSGALPDSLTYNRGQQLALQERIAQVDRESATLRDQRQRLVQVFEATGQVTEAAAPASPRNPDQIQLDSLRQQLAQALLVFSPENPKVQMLQRRIEQLEASLAAAAAVSVGETPAEPVNPAKAMFDLQLSEIDTRLAALATQRETDQARLDEVNEAIARTPRNEIVLASMQRDYDNLQAQYNAAVAKLAQASTGQRIELLARGEKASVLEQPAVPTEPAKLMGYKLILLSIAAGVAAGGGLIVLLEMINGTVRRPADLVARMGMSPIATIPYLSTRREIFQRRIGQVAMVVLVILIVPAALAAVNRYYLPLDLLADRVLGKLGLRS